MSGRGKNVTLEQRYVAARLHNDALAAGLPCAAYKGRPVLAGVRHPGVVGRRFANRLAAKLPLTDAPRSVEEAYSLGFQYR